MVFFLGCFCYCHGIAQGLDCVQEVLACQKNTFEWNRPNYPHPTFLQFEMQIQQWDNTLTESNIKLYRQGRRVHLLTEQMDFIQDEQESFLVLHEEKIVLKKDHSNISLPVNYLDGFQNLQEEFFSTCKTINCGSYGENYKKVTFSTDGTSVSVDYLDQLTFIYSSSKNQVEEVFALYKEGYQVKSIRQKIKNLDLDAAFVFPENARAYFFENDYDLKDRFKNYQFIDQQ